MTNEKLSTMLNVEAVSKSNRSNMALATNRLMNLKPTPYW